MNQYEFIKWYCEGSGITPQQLHEIGEVALPCTCGEKGCKGWAMVSGDRIWVHLDLYFKKPETL